MNPDLGPDPDPDPDLEVDADDVRRTAFALAETAARVAAGTEQAPSAETTPRWVTVDPALLAAEAARHQLAQIGADIADTAQQIALAADDYELADARAATRLRLTR